MRKRQRKGTTLRIKEVDGPEKLFNRPSLPDNSRLLKCSINGYYGTQLILQQWKIWVQLTHPNIKQIKSSIPNKTFFTYLYYMVKHASSLKIKRSNETKKKYTPAALKYDYSHFCLYCISTVLLHLFLNVIMLHRIRIRIKKT